MAGWMAGRGNPSVFEIVHTLMEWYDGERKGIANFQGIPHLFESEWRDGDDLEAKGFLLMPLDAATVALALEDWAIYRRWETAFRQGNTTEDTHPALPEDQSRHAELERLLNGRLAIDPSRSVRKGAEFQVRTDPHWSGYGVRPLEVRWIDL